MCNLLFEIVCIDIFLDIGFILQGLAILEIAQGHTNRNSGPVLDDVLLFPLVVHVDT